jgi:hypothetical protein
MFYVTHPEHRECLWEEVSPEIVGVDGPDHSTGDAQVVDELGLQGEGLNVVVTDPVRTVH